MKASHRQQLIVLKLQQHDTLISRLRRQRVQLPARLDLEALQGELQATKSAFMALQRVTDMNRAEISRLENDIEMVRERKARNTALLAGSSSSREAQNLQAELDRLADRQLALEDRELEIMETVEAAQSEYNAAEEALNAVDGRRASLQSAIVAGEELIDRELADVIEERAGLAAELQRDILDLYEDLRSRYGLGAALLRGNVSEASNMTLAPAEMQQIMATPRDEIVFCPGTGVMLVRTGDE